MSVTRGAWNKFVKARDHYRLITEELDRSLPKLKKLQQKLADTRSAGKTRYKVETPVVYNRAIDDVTMSDDIRLILVADNPGRREQAAENRRYLVGPSGKIAERFFKNNPGLKIDFRKNVLILNKTPIHTPRTNELRELCRLESKAGKLSEALEASQRDMAALLLEFHLALSAGENKVPVWIIGYSEMKKGGIFEAYTETIKKLYEQAGKYKYNQIYLFRHFSMNQFTIDLNQQAKPGESVAESLGRIGAAYRQRILGF